MKRVGYYKSCSLNASSNDYARSLEMSFSKLGTRLVPIDRLELLRRLFGPFDQ